jgi:hypothetical protein
MKNLWPERFEPESLPPPKSLLQDQAGLLAKITGGMVQAEVTPLEGTEPILYSLENDFGFRFDLVGPFLDNYRFTVLRFAHDIAMYPVSVVIDKPISEELFLPDIGTRGGKYTVSNPEEMEVLLERIFQSSRIRKVVGSIIALSK